ncbi:MAG TPA: hypothetical protein VKE51_09350 [Vicinamibacterales bacterium]|nr:hypothetical protein [Vicinamibacterales bacterium]
MARSERNDSLHVRKAIESERLHEMLLAQKIDDAATDGVITAARSKRAHEDIRVLGTAIPLPAASVLALSPTPNCA